MISTSFKKQLIIDAYKTQLLPDTNDEIHKISTSSNKHIKNFLLFKIEDESLWLKYFKIEDESLWLKYKYKFNNINYNISLVLTHLKNLIYSIYYYNSEENFHIQENILDNIQDILERKHNFDNSPDYAKYLEDIYD